MSSFNTSKNSPESKVLTMLAKNAYRKGMFTLASGRQSQHYVNCKPVTLSGLGLSLLSLLLLKHVDKDASAVAGLTLGADPLVSAVVIAGAQAGFSLDALIVRKEAKDHGTGSWLEGPLPEKGALVTVLEDVVTSGGSSLKAVNQLRQAGYLVRQVVAIVDRQEGADIAMKEADIELTSLYLLEDVIARAEDLV